MEETRKQSPEEREDASFVTREVIELQTALKKKTSETATKGPDLDHRAMTLERAGMTEEARAEVANTEADLETTVLTQDLEVDLKSRKGQEGHHPTLMRAEMANDLDQDSQETLSQLSKSASCSSSCTNPRCCNGIDFFTWSPLALRRPPPTLLVWDAKANA